MSNYVTPVIGQTCPALTKENYECALSGDLGNRYICALTDKPCIAKVYADPDNQSSEFFSRAKVMLDPKRFDDCPCYGISKDTFKTILKERSDKKLQEKLNNL